MEKQGAESLDYKEWPPNQIQRAALKSGKPLEVRCAEILFSEGWVALLGTYCTDLSPNLVRELDVLARR
jgi:hypothetical protein